MSSSIQPGSRQQAALPASLTTQPAATAVVSGQEASLENMLQEFRIRKSRPISRTGANFKSAVEAVWTNRTRSILTMLAIFIGVGAVVAVFILTQGVSSFILAQSLSSGANSITIDTGTTQMKGPSHKTAGLPLTFQDYNALLRVPRVTDSSPIINTGGGQAIYGNQNWKTSGKGVSASYQSINSWNMAQGIWFSDADNSSLRSVAVIGDTVYQNLFAPLNVNPIGKTILYRGQPLHPSLAVTAAKADQPL